MTYSKQRLGMRAYMVIVILLSLWAGILLCRCYHSIMYEPHEHHHAPFSIGE